MFKHVFDTPNSVKQRHIPLYIALKTLRKCLPGLLCGHDLRRDVFGRCATRRTRPRPRRVLLRRIGRAILAKMSVWDTYIETDAFFMKFDRN